MCKHHTNRPGKSLKHSEEHAQDHQQWSRRGFLSTLGMGLIGSALSLNGLSLNAMSRNPFLEQLAQSSTDRVLVLIQLSGGNDGLNTVIPVRNDIYYQKRPQIAIPRQQSLRLSDDIHLHSAMQPLLERWDQAKMSIIHNVGYSQPERSHSTATTVWTSGTEVAESLNTGWMGRYLSNAYPDYESQPPAYPLGVRIGGSSSLFESDFGNLGMTFTGSSDFESFMQQGGLYNIENLPEGTYGDALRQACEISNKSFRYLDAISAAAENSNNLTDYPDNPLAASLAVVARLIRGRLGSRVYLLSLGGFDTHNAQGGVQGAHAALLGQLSGSIAAFYTDLEQDGMDQKALTMTFSEFGRTLDQNGNLGTDHGSSAPVMLFGPVEAGFIGEHANLIDLDDEGDPIYEIDYRSVYQSVLRDWFELSEEGIQEVIPGTYDNLSLIQGTATSVPDTLPTSFRLEQNYPNPFNPSTSIRFELLQAGYVQLEVFDLNGRLVKSLVAKRLHAGIHEIAFNASNLSSGTYIYRLRMANQTLSRKMTLLK